MKRIDPRILVGAVLVLGGLLMLLDQLGILKGASLFYWAAVLAAGALVFLVWFFRPKGRWWAAIPGFTLAGMAASTLLSPWTGWGGVAFLGGIGLGFWAAYLRARRHWWAIIPGGVLLNLGAVSALTEVYRITNTAGVFFVGLGLTFLLVGLLEKMKWAYIPAGVLLIVGFILGSPFVGALQYAWIGILLLAGILLVVSALVGS